MQKGLKLKKNIQLYGKSETRTAKKINKVQKRQTYFDLFDLW
jgi:hypothetical protein